MRCDWYKIPLINWSHWVYCVLMINVATDKHREFSMHEISVSLRIVYRSHNKIRRISRTMKNDGLESVLFLSVRYILIYGPYYTRQLPHEIWTLSSYSMRVCKSPGQIALYLLWMRLIYPGWLQQLMLMQAISIRRVHTCYVSLTPDWIYRYSR